MARTVDRREAKVSIATNGHPSVTAYLRALCWTMREGDVVYVRREDVGTAKVYDIRRIIGLTIFTVRRLAGRYRIERVVRRKAGPCA